MKTASLNELKKELSNLESSELKDVILRFARYKKENKELLSYLLFDSNDEQAYIERIKEDLEVQFQEINKKNTYSIKKSLRKILRFLNKYIKYSGVLQTEAELLIHFCQSMKKSGIDLNRSPLLLKMYQMQIKKINQSLSKMHEDLRYDYQQAIEEL